MLLSRISGLAGSVTGEPGAETVLRLDQTSATWLHYPSRARDDMWRERPRTTLFWAEACAHSLTPAILTVTVRGHRPHVKRTVRDSSVMALGGWSDGDWVIGGPVPAGEESKTRPPINKCFTGSQSAK